MEYFLLLSAPFVGMLVGFLPALGATLTMLLLYPFLLHFGAYFIILFYCIMINAKEFSGSVSALSFNLPGEITSAPVIAERPLIISENLQINALKNTMIGSLAAMLIGMVVLYFSLFVLTNYKVLLRTDVIALMLTLCVVILWLYRNNSRPMNLLLIGLGYMIGSIGYDHFTHKEFLTFGNSYLSGGIPTLAFIFGVYALPKLYEMWSQTRLQPPLLGSGGILYPVSRSAVLRGSMIGSVLGLVPFIGTTISSNMAHHMEAYFHKAKNGLHALARITASESANNAGQVTVLIPLLVMGLAIQPSEFVVIDMLQAKQWHISQSSEPEFLWLLAIAMSIGCIITALFCYAFVTRTLYFLYQNISYIFFGIITLSLANILYMGYQSDQTIYYILVVMISSCLGFLAYYRRVDMMPCIVLFLLENNYSDALIRLPELYGF